MTKEQALWMLRGIYGHLDDRVWEYVEQTEKVLEGSSCWETLSEEAIRRDASLFMQALAMEAPNAK